MATFLLLGTLRFVLSVPEIGPVFLGDPLFGDSFLGAAFFGEALLAEDLATVFVSVVFFAGLVVLVVFPFPFVLLCPDDVCFTCCFGK